MSRSWKQVVTENKENVGVTQVKLYTIPVASSQVLSTFKDIFLINTEQSVNPNLILSARNVQVPAPSDVISQVNNSVLRDVMLTKKVENIERSKVSGTVHVSEFPETVEVNDANVNIVNSGVKEGVQEQSKDTKVPEKKSDILSGTKVISSGMKIVG